MVTFQDAYLDGANEFHLLCFGLLLGGYENIVCANYASSYPLVPEDRTRTVCCIVTRYKQHLTVCFQGLFSKILLSIFIVRVAANLIFYFIFSSS